jgi:hypothetical protein
MGQWRAIMERAANPTHGDGPRHTEIEVFMKAKTFQAAGALITAAALFGCNNLTGSVEATTDDDGSGIIDPGVKPGGQSPGAKSMKCAYPGGNIGVDLDQVIPVTHAWEGYVPGEDGPATLHIADLFDCDASLGIHAILFDTSQFG